MGFESIIGRLKDAIALLLIGRDDVDILRVAKHVVENSPDGIIVTGEDLNTITFFSRGAERIYCISADEAIGKKAKELYTDPCERDSLLEIIIKEGEVTHETSSSSTRRSPLCS